MARPQAPPAAIDSRVRIVTLTFALGGVELRRPQEDDWQPALAAMPLVEGAALRSHSSGRAEIELDCGSAVRLDHDSELALSQLRLSSAGLRATTVRLLRGNLFLDLHNHDGDDFHLLLPAGELTAMVPSARVQVDLGAAGPAVVRVEDGVATVVFEQHRLQLKRGQMATLQAGSPPRALRAGPRNAWGDWNRDQDLPPLPLPGDTGRGRGGVLRPPEAAAPAPLTPGSFPACGRG